MAVNPTERVNHKKYIPQGHKHLALGNKKCGREGKGPHAQACDQVELNLLGFKINLEYDGKSYRESESQKIYSSGA
jgi:hypothetical protein